MKAGCAAADPELGNEILPRPGSAAPNSGDNTTTQAQNPQSLRTTIKFYKGG